ncbi:hypothetical protein GA0116948_10968 [Chitinophaga costaii]|uniref:Uncharacterized protein n=1 Tax=Chitinophaga costaii TaxID=1335309 RepID=A0A1C4ENP7_9BACT|nr:hypothetical protein [Chitinophaga costaii]PUZ22472.1 hypothetical protein DCM91_14480 [Chitinophaga costaii]SCC45204.1 hypothetical protein GA0116948_10968 [Chitinophaga costaii]
MEADELKKIWQVYDQRLEQALHLNLLNLREIQTLKAKSALHKMLWVKWLGIILGIGWVWCLPIFINAALYVHNYFFAFSAGFHLLVTVIAIVVYLQHVIRIYKVNNANTVLEVQEQLAKLQTSTLQIARLLFLQLPVFTTFYLHTEMFHNGSYWWIAQVLVTGLFTWAGIWLYRNIAIKNVHKRWFLTLFNSPEWTQLTKAMLLLDEIAVYKKETPVLK